MSLKEKLGRFFDPYKPIVIDKPCLLCRGSGKIPKMTMPWVWIPKECPQCNGSGRIIGEKT